MGIAIDMEKQLDELIVKVAGLEQAIKGCIYRIEQITQGGEGGKKTNNKASVNSNKRSSSKDRGTSTKADKSGSSSE